MTNHSISRKRETKKIGRRTNVISVSSLLHSVITTMFVPFFFLLPSHDRNYNGPSSSSFPHTFCFPGISFSFFPLFFVRQIGGRRIHARTEKYFKRGEEKLTIIALFSTVFFLGPVPIQISPPPTPHFPRKKEKKLPPGAGEKPSPTLV